MYKNLARELKKNTDVMEMTFKKFNLQVLQFTYRPYDEEDADCYLVIEVATISGNKISRGGHIKVNLYDENGEIIDTASAYIDEDEFGGYDTFRILICDEGRMLIEAKTARIYMVE